MYRNCWAVSSANSEALLSIDSATDTDVGYSQTFSYHTESTGKLDVGCADLVEYS